MSLLIPILASWMIVGYTKAWRHSRPVDASVRVLCTLLGPLAWLTHIEPDPIPGQPDASQYLQIGRVGISAWSNWTDLWHVREWNWADFNLIRIHAEWANYKESAELNLALLGLNLSLALDVSSPADVSQHKY